MRGQQNHPIKYIKYPRTPHLPWSQGTTTDDSLLKDVKIFQGQEVVITEKMDGENTTMYPDHIHARSIDSRHHPSRTWVKGLHGSIAHMIPKGWRLCGENLYAQHSIIYENLKSYFYLFSIWNEHNQALNWDETEKWAKSLDLALVPVLYRGQWDESLARALKIDTQTREGYVVRTAAGFTHAEFSNHIAKWVRKGHVQTDEHWMHSKVIPNGLAKK